jgi:hypothetical protein
MRYALLLPLAALIGVLLGYATHRLYDYWTYKSIARRYRVRSFGTHLEAAKRSWEDDMWSAWHLLPDTEPGQIPAQPEQSPTVSLVAIPEPSTDSTKESGRWTLTSGAHMAGWRLRRHRSEPQPTNKIKSLTEGGLLGDGSRGPAPASWADESWD